MTRQALARIPDGTYRYVDYLDNDGIELDRPIRIEVAVTVEGRRHALDFTGTSAAGARAVQLRAVRLPRGRLLRRPRPDRSRRIPTNGGCFRPISLHLPKGSHASIRGSRPPVNARTATIKRITGCDRSARCAECAAGHACRRRPPARCWWSRSAAGTRTGAPFVTGELIAGGSGAGPARDGVDVIETDATNCMNLPAEAMEMEAPIRVHRVALRPIPAAPAVSRRPWHRSRIRGAGRRRDASPIAASDTSAAARGLSGGGDGAAARSVIKRRDGTTAEIPSKIVTRLHKGDRVVVETAGGAGHGNPALRDPDARARDLADGKVTHGTAAV